MKTNCFTTDRASAPCSTCGDRPKLLHVPRNVKGFFCSDHCPVCNPPAPRAAGERE